MWERHGPLPTEDAVAGSSHVHRLPYEGQGSLVEVVRLLEVVMPCEAWHVSLSHIRNLMVRTQGTDLGTPHSTLGLPVAPRVG